MENTRTDTLELQPITNKECSSNPGLQCPTTWLRACTGNPCLIDTTKSESGQGKARRPEVNESPEDDVRILARIGDVATLHTNEVTES